MTPPTWLRVLLRIAMLVGTYVEWRHKRQVGIVSPPPGPPTDVA
jgi:hypothetical protein